MTSSTTLSKLTAGYAAGLKSLASIVTELLRGEHNLDFTPAHVDDIVAALVDSDPAVLPAVVRAGEITDGVRGLARSALQALKAARPFLFMENPSRDARARTTAGVRFGTHTCSPAVWSSLINDADLSGAMGREGQRREWVANAESLAAAGKGHLVDSTLPPSTNNIFGNPSDPRNSALRAGAAPDPSLPAVTASRAETMALEKVRHSISGDPRRPAPQKMAKLFAPTGELVDVPSSKVSDCVMLKGYRRPDGVQHPGPAVVAAPNEDEGDDAAPSAPSTAPTAFAPLVNSKITSLRAECRSLGVSVDPIWGVRRLSEEIEKAKAAAETLPEPTPPTAA